MVIMVNLPNYIPPTVPKQTQIIQFSLLSPGITEGRWMVRPESSSKHQTPKQRLAALNRKRALKKKEEERIRKGVLHPKTIERLKQVLLQLMNIV